ncbi:MAG: hypothetical protein JXJ17_00100 [Anaerolineae bacterium]|nr:hypothetical protein [Anaerolineae bacterium]
MTTQVPNPTIAIDPKSGREKRGSSRLLWTITVLLLIAVAIAAILTFVVWPWMIRWGATDAEVDMALPGDDYVPGISMQTTKALTIDAAPDQVYPWLLQLGVDRGGMYSYTWIENLFGLHVTNVTEIVPAYQDVEVGDFLRFVPPDFGGGEPGPGLYVMEMVENEAFILCFTIEGESVDVCPATWQFVLIPQSDRTTRLILRNRITAGDSWQNTPFGRLFMYPTFVMERKMLLTIRAEAEELAAGGGENDQPGGSMTIRPVDALYTHRPKIIAR